MRKLYRGVVWLHPAAFRLRFEQELLWIYDEAAPASGVAALFGDACVSLTRQWLLRSGLWKWAVASIGGMILLIIAFGSFLPWDRPAGR